MLTEKRLKLKIKPQGEYASLEKLDQLVRVVLRGTIVKHQQGDDLVNWQDEDGNYEVILYRLERKEYARSAIQKLGFRIVSEEEVVKSLDFKWGGV